METNPTGGTRRFFASRKKSTSIDLVYSSCLFQCSIRTSNNILCYNGAVKHLKYCSRGDHNVFNVLKSITHILRLGESEGYVGLLANKTARCSSDGWERGFH